MGNKKSIDVLGYVSKYNVKLQGNCHVTITIPANALASGIKLLRYVGEANVEVKEGNNLLGKFMLLQYKVDADCETQLKMLSSDSEYKAHNIHDCTQSGRLLNLKFEEVEEE